MFNYNDERLDAYATTAVKLEALNAYREHGTIKKAAAAIGKTTNCVNQILYQLQQSFNKRNHVNEQETEQENEFDVNEKLDQLSDNYHKIASKNKFTMAITSAQNSTPVHTRFFKNLQVLEKKLKANLLVIPFRYKNPTSVHLDGGKDYWAQELQPYLCEDDFFLNDNLCVLGKLKSQPTAVRPLSGLESVSGSRSAIMGHTKLELKSVATPGNRMPKTLVSTGCCTVSNYTDSKAGYKGNSQHSLSAIIVEVEGNAFFMRQIIGDDNGDFIDMLTEYKNGKALPAPQAEVLSTGDLHGINCDIEAVNATFYNKDSMLNYFRPKYVTMDDTLDFQAGSHHGKKDPIVQHTLAKQGLLSIENELKHTFGLIDKVYNDYTKIVIKRSNHDEHFERWVKETDPRFDTVNGRLWCEAFPVMLDHKDPYEHFAKKWLNCFDNVVFLERDESFVVNGVSHDGHGDLGTNGSRGSLQQFTKLGTAGQWGHSHTAGIMDDQYQNGTLSKLRMGYNKGPSSWMHCNTIQYANGKRSLLFIIDGKWRH